jgi:hypothetical protein
MVYSFDTLVILNMLYAVVEMLPTSLSPRDNPEYAPDIALGPLPSAS